MASARVVASRMQPRTADVTVRDCAFFYATHGHAHVIAFGDHDHATCFDTFPQRVGHLLGEALLHLRTSGIQFHQSCKLA